MNRNTNQGVLDRTETIDIAGVAESYHRDIEGITRRVIVCAGTGCVANGSLKIFDELKKQIAAAGLPVVIELKHEDEASDGAGTAGAAATGTAGAAGPKGTMLSRSGCQGFCQMGPLVTIEPDHILYTKVKIGDVAEIVSETLAEGKVVERLLYREPATGKHCKGVNEIPFYVRQKRETLALCGRIDPEDIREYIANGGYEAARLAYRELTPPLICQEITNSGLRGRGGGGFPTGKKWELTRVQPGPEKYVICNADEGDPGAFMDRSVMEGNPHSVIEGMMIAARAIGAQAGRIYVRMEYPLAVERVRKAVRDAEACGILGDNLFGTGQAFTMEVMEGAGAFVCGEETALISSLEGKRGMPLPKPPFPAQSGYKGKPTVINNVETLATVPLILRMGSGEFRRIGTAASPGTKTFALTGHVANAGLIEVPLGTTLREIIFRIGGGVTDDEGNLLPDGFKAVQIGGPSGGCLTAEHLDLPLDFDSLKGVGAMVGSGGLVVMNTGTCMVKIARFFMKFTQNESCGKCVLCREGTKQMLALLDDITEGRGTEETLDLLKQTAQAVRIGSLCGLGKTAPNPVLSTMRYFYPEYEAHVFQKRCPAGECEALTPPAIDETKCIGCTACARKCPVGAITGEKKMPHRIDPGLCIRCGACAQACKFGAIKGVKK